MFGRQTDWVGLRNLTPTRNLSIPLHNGRITITNNKEKHIVIFKQGITKSHRWYENGRKIKDLVYGDFERGKGLRLRFHPKSGRCLDGMCMRKDKYAEIFGYHGKVITCYKKGRLIWQRFYHDNGKVAYYLHAMKPLLIKYPDGKPLLEWNGQIETRFTREGLPIIDNAGSWKIKEDNYHHLRRGDDASFIRYDKQGGIIQQGQWKNNQRVGKWIDKNETKYYERGVEVPKYLYETPADKIDPKHIITIDNAQLRGAMITKVGINRIAELGKIIHKQKDMMLLEIPITKRKDITERDIPDKVMRLLKVKCPSTKTDYTLQVPPEAKTCEEARQFGFLGRLPRNKREYMKFVEET